MNNLEIYKCPKCFQEMKNNNKPVKTTSNYSDCIRKCAQCHIGVSNTNNSPTIIYENPLDNIPDFIRPKNMLSIMDKSINERNKKNKKQKAGFSTSEDIMTYVFIQYYIQNKKIDKLLELFDIGHNTKENINIYLWGSPASIMNENVEFIHNIKNTLHKELKENKNSLTEPDIIITIENMGIIIVEVKFKSGNEIKPEERLKKYINDEFLNDIEKIKQSRHYELLRNWIIGNQISGSEKFILFNLGPKKLFNDKNKDKLEIFENAIKQNDLKQFKRITWEEIIEKIDSKDIEIKEYLTKKLSAI